MSFNESSGRFDFVLASAVWMHLRPDRPLASLARLKDLPKEQGRIALTLRIGAPNVGRVIYPISANEILGHARVVGLTPLYVSPEETNSLGRGEVKWRNVVLTKSP
ncbi:hypothetical protein [Massilia sp. H6]|uniref:hypothetical protein n=1 Tax=Massilia sp. H6 TaxID=2970464 RepID=UPI00216AAE79|nr:hypothetical protein [Massilia sp. H6]UVW30732.1 hypothetical protein NRS07_20055 [Massilia sp. H6]